MRDGEEQPMTLLAHGGAGVVNTWGIAYTCGIIGLFSVSLLYVKGKVTERTAVDGTVSKRSLLAAIGPGAIAVGGVCGVSIGLGIAGIAESFFDHDVEVTEVVAELCQTSYGPAAIDGALHDDIEHVIDDLDDEASRTIHQQLHDDPVTGDEALVVVDRLIVALTVADGQPATSCEA